MFSTSHDDATSEWCRADELINISTVSTKPLIAIEYPGIVEDTDKALETLGGLGSISKLLLERRKLSLRFRPDDPYCSSAYATKQEVNNILLRVRRRRKHTASAAGLCEEAGASSCDTADEPFEYKVEILGVVSTTHRFQGMCDYQYLPAVKKTDGSYESILDKIMPRSYTTSTEFFSRNVPLFLPPLIFSRYDTPQDYGFRNDRHYKQTESADVTGLDTELQAGSVRKRRRAETKYISFHDKEVPMAPPPHTLEAVVRLKEVLFLEEVKKKFAERPIWSKAALRYHLRHCPQSGLRLKVILPAVSYYFTSGPWRALWVRFGYDPRKDPSAKKYQMLDFRVRQKPGFTTEEKSVPLAKRDMDKIFLRPMQYPSIKPAEHEINMGDFDDADSHSDKPSHAQPKLSDFEFHPDVMPPTRQVYYQLCDIYDQEVQALISKNDGKEGGCDEKNGWCVNNIHTLCRDVMMQHVHKLEPQFPAGSINFRKKESRIKRLRTKLEEDSDEGDENVA